MQEQPKDEQVIIRQIDVDKATAELIADLPAVSEHLELVQETARTRDEDLNIAFVVRTPYFN